LFRNNFGDRVSFVMASLARTAARSWGILGGQNTGDCRLALGGADAYDCRMNKAWFALAVIALVLLAVLGWYAVIPVPAPAVRAADECPVHHIKMTATALPIGYGMPPIDEFDDADVAVELFPFGRNYVRGGCVKEQKKTEDGFLCPECVTARAAWLKKHGD
jgi:hypothetical protein